MSVSKYPLEVSDEEGTVDAINYLLSGPAGLGQNFAGFSTYVPAYLRPTERQPFVTPITDEPTPLYSEVPCNNAFGCDDNGNPVGLTSTRYVLYTFTTPFTSPPFRFGDRIYAGGFTPNDYDSSTVYGPPDSPSLVYACTNTYVIIRYNGSFSFPPYVSGGYVGFNRLNQKLSTDCNGRVTINGGNDRVFISAQLNLDAQVFSLFGAEFDIVVQINRYTGYLDTSPGSTDFVFASPVETLAQKIHHYNFVGGSGIPVLYPDIDNYFVQFVDGPNIPFGYYWYILEVSFVTKPYYRTSFAIGGFDQATLSGTSVSQVASYTSITPTTVTGSGSGLDIDIDIDTTNSTNYINCAEIVTINNPGINYQVGDILTIPGTSLGGTSPANDMTLVITQIAYAGTIVGKIFTLNLRSLSAQVVKQ